MKATLKELELHKAIKDKDEIALSKLYDLYGVSIIRALKRWSHTTAQKDEALILEAVNEAFFGYYKNPHTFDPRKYTLQRFLEIAADRDLKNLLQKEKKKIDEKNILDDVQLWGKLRNSIIGSDDFADAAMIMDELMEAIRKILEKYFSTDEDILLAKMVLAEIRETEEYSKVLGIEVLPLSEQRDQVTKHKNRIKKVLERKNVEPMIKRLLQ